MCSAKYCLASGQITLVKDRTFAHGRQRAEGKYQRQDHARRPGAPAQEHTGECYSSGGGSSPDFCQVRSPDAADLPLPEELLLCRSQDAHPAHPGQAQDALITTGAAKNAWRKRVKILLAMVSIAR